MVHKDKMGTYFVTIFVGAEWSDACDLRAFPLTPAGDEVKVMRTDVEHTGLGDVLFANLVTKLVLTPRTAFMVDALCISDPLAHPVGFEIKVQQRLLEAQLNDAHYAQGEAVLGKLVAKAAGMNLLFKKATSWHNQYLPPPEPKRRKTHHVEPVATSKLFEWMRAREERTLVRCDHPEYIDIPGGEYVFCLKDFLFVLRRRVGTLPIDVHGGMIVGERNAGKTRTVVELIKAGFPVRADSRTYDFLTPLPLTLVVVPFYLVDHWGAEAARASVGHVVVHDKHTWMTHMRLESARRQQMVITTTAFFFSHMHTSQTKSRASSRRTAAAPLEERGGEVLRLDEVLWDRIVYDEVLGVYSDYGRTWKRVLRYMRARTWWGLQGGISLDSLCLVPLVEMLLSNEPADRTRGLYDLETFLHHSIYAAPSLPVASAAFVDNIHLIELNSAERKVYDMLRTKEPPSTLLQVCCGDFAPVDKHMRIVSHWLDAVPLGLAELDMQMSYMMASEEAESESSGPSAHDDDDNFSGFTQPPTEPPTPTAAPGAPFPLSLGDTSTEQQLINFVVRASNDALSRKTYFRKVAMDFAQLHPADIPSCSICLTNACDCLFVCGHVMCHTCVLALFDARKTQLEDDEDDRWVTVPCPECRWELSTDEVFWILGTIPRIRSKGTALTQLLRSNMDKAQRTIVFASSDEVLHFMHEQLLMARINCKPWGSSVRVCHKRMTWFQQNPSRVLLVSLSKLSGLKFHGVQHAVFLHPVMDDIHMRQELEMRALKCLLSDPGRVLQVHHLIAANTIEHVVA
jgi:hypothetical protein